MTIKSIPDKLLQEIKQPLDFLPSRFKREVSKELVYNKAIQDGLKWLDSDKTFWFLTGGTGTGKTIAALRIAIEAMERGLLDRFGESFTPPAFNYTEAFAYQAKCEESKVYAINSSESKNWLLILDELGTEPIPRDPTYWMAQIDYLVDQRYQRDLKTILVSNKSWNFIKSTYPERMIDRLKGSSILTTISGGSMRGR